MKPADQIAKEKTDLEFAIVGAICTFRTNTGCEIDSIIIPFFEVTNQGSVRKTTDPGKIEIKIIV